MTNTAFKTLSVSEQVFKDLVWTPLIKGGEKLIEVDIPFFALPIVSTAEETTINDTSDYLFNLLVLWLDISAIKFIDAKYQTAYDSASEQLSIILQEKGANSNEYQTARASALSAQSHWTNIASN